LPHGFADANALNRESWPGLEQRERTKGTSKVLFVSLGRFVRLVVFSPISNSQTSEKISRARHAWRSWS